MADSEWRIRTDGNLLDLPGGDTQADFLADGPFGVRARVEAEFDSDWFADGQPADKFPPGAYVEAAVRPMGGLTETFHVIASSSWPLILRVRALLFDDETGECMAESAWIEMPAGQYAPSDKDPQIL
jgi:hypothetical protein